MKTSIYGKGLFTLKAKIYLRMFALFSAVILLTACGSASVGDKVVENTGEAEATPTLPPGRGPSAVFPASYAPWEPTPTPTPAPPTPTPVPETEWTRVKEMLTYKFEPYIESPQKTESDFSSRQEYESFIKDYCEKKYNENMAYVQNTDIDTLYVRLEDSRCGPNEFEEKVFLAIKNKDTISAWKQAIASMRPQKRANYPVEESKVIYCGGFISLEFFVEKDGKIQRVFQTDRVALHFGVSYFENGEPDYFLPYATESDDEYFHTLYSSLTDYIHEEIYRNYDSGNKVHLVFE